MGKIDLRSKREFEEVQSILDKSSVEHIDFRITDMSIISLEQIDYLIDKVKTGSITITSNEGEYDAPERYTYTFEEYRELRKSVNQILAEIDLELPDVDRFIQIYKKLGESINYAWDEITEEPSQEDEAHNLKGPLIEKCCVCEGYALALRQVLLCAGIEAKYIVDIANSRATDSMDETENHAWNQVKIQGKWYNCDLTWDVPNIEESCMPSYCLQSDEDFLNHGINCEWREICFESYDREEIRLKIKPLRGKIQGFRKELILFCKGEYPQDSKNLENICEELNLDYEEELENARKRARLESELEECGENISEEKQKSLEELANSLGLDFEWEKMNALYRIYLKEQIQRYLEQEDDIDREELEAECDFYGISFSHEMKKAKKRFVILPEQIKEKTKGIESEKKREVQRIEQGEMEENEKEGR